MKLLIPAISLILLAGCGGPKDGEAYSAPALVCTAPDGTKLWSVHVRGTGAVFFSSQGASWETTRDQGDHVATVTRHTPHAQRPIPPQVRP